MEVSQYTMKVPIKPGLGWTAMAYVELHLTKKADSSSWIVSSPSLDSEWTFLSLDIAEDRVENELIPLIQDYFNAKSDWDHARRALDEWEFGKVVLGAATKPAEDAKV